MTTYKVIEAPKNGTVGQDVGVFSLTDLPARLRAAVEADLEAGEWTLPALVDGDSGEELSDLDVVVSAEDTNANERSEAYHTGYEAHEQGEPRDANPYPDGSWNAGEWFEGWDEADS